MEEYREAGVLYKESVEKSKDVCQTGSMAAELVLDAVKNVMAKTMSEHDLADFKESLIEVVEMLIREAKDMQGKLDEVHIKLGVVRALCDIS